MAIFGLVLLALVALGLSLSGLPTFLLVLLVSGFGAMVAALSGQVPVALLSALPNRLVNLLESDLLQALPLFVMMGALMNRLPVVPALLRSGMALRPRSAAMPSLVALALGALLGPMNGSVGASVLALARSLVPQLRERGMRTADVAALTVVASTLGVVVPPSLVLILLGDAMMSAHTIAVNATGHAARIVNTQDLFRATLGPAACFLVLSMAVSWMQARRQPSGTPPTGRTSLSAGDVLLAIAVVFLVAGLLVGVAAGLFYAVEAAAFGAFALFIAAAVSGGLSGRKGSDLLHEVIAATGSLMALLVAATTLTLVLRVLGTDRLVADAVRHIPGGPVAATSVVLVLVGLSGLVLDAFEIIFVVVPVVAPPLLERAEDAAWVATLLLLVLQSSFLLPPFGYAVLLVQGTLRPRPEARALYRALLPFLMVQGIVLLAVLLQPRLVHLFDGATPASDAPALDDRQVDQRFKDLPLPDDDLPPPSLR